MTDNQLTPEEQEAVEVVAKFLCEKDNHGWTDKNFKSQSWLKPYYENEAKELLNLRGKCKACNGTGEKPDPLAAHGFPQFHEGCPVCHGTGEGEKLLLIRAENQDITDILRTELDAYTERLLAHPMNMPQHMEIAIASLSGALSGFRKVVNP